MTRSLGALAVALVAAVSAAAQLEMNDPGGSLTSNGADVFAVTNLVGAAASIDMEVGGNPLAPFALVGGNRVGATGSTPLGDGQFFDLANDGTAYLLGNGLGGGGAIPASLMVTNGNGQAAFSFPVNPGVIGLCFGFQAVVFDAAQLFQVNFTAAAEFCVTTALVLQGDDVFAPFTPPSGTPYLLYGQNFLHFDVSTNGWLKFGATSTSSDPTESPIDFVSGNAGGGTPGPVFAPLWEDLDMGNGPASMLIVDEPVPGITTCTWMNGDYFPATPFGTFVLTIDMTGGTFQAALDFSAYANGAPPSEGLVGVSDGGIAAATIQSHELVIAGFTNPFTGTGVETVFQNFDGDYAGTPAMPLPAEPFDVPISVLLTDGLGIVHFVDTNGFGRFSYF